jgi:hypothetical protein
MYAQMVETGLKKVQDATGMRHPPTLAPLAARRGAGQSVGAALPD